MNNILAIDASSKATGQCVGNKDGIIDYGCITSSSTDVIKRILIMRDGLSDLIKKYDIKEIVLEEVRTDYKNAHTYKILTWLQSAIVIAAYEIDKKIKVEYLQPSAWRAAVGIHTGRGVKRDTLKKADIDYVNATYNLNISSDDIADAIGVYSGYLAKEKCKNEINQE